MQLRPLPTLRFDAYDKAKKELSILVSDEAITMLKLIGSNRSLSLPMLRAGLRGCEDPIVDIVLTALVAHGYVLPEDRPVEYVYLGGSKMVDTTFYRVNWKQIRKLNKAISLL